MAILRPRLGAPVISEPTDFRRDSVVTVDAAAGPFQFPLRLETW